MTEEDLEQMRRLSPDELAQEYTLEELELAQELLMRMLLEEDG